MARPNHVCTATTSYNEPFHIARKFASLDHISGGRGLFRTEYTGCTLRGHLGLPCPPSRYEPRATETAE